MSVVVAVDLAGAGSLQLRAVARKRPGPPTVILGLYRAGALASREWGVPPASMKAFARAVGELVRQLEAQGVGAPKVKSPPALPAGDDAAGADGAASE